MLDYMNLLGSSDMFLLIGYVYMDVRLDRGIVILLKRLEFLNF